MGYLGPPFQGLIVGCFTTSPIFEINSVHLINDDIEEKAIGPEKGLFFAYNFINVLTH